MRTYQKLVIWQEAMEVVAQVYRLTQSFPIEERYGLCSQMRRAAISVPSNIAEGRGRQNDKEFVRFLYISMGSLLELETQMTIAARLEYLTDDSEIMEAIDKLHAKIQRMINTADQRSGRRLASSV